MTGQVDPPGGVHNAVWMASGEPPQAVPAGAWVEVVHRPRQAPPHPFLPHPHGMWMFKVPGSGVAVNVGRTLVLSDHGFDTIWHVDRPISRTTGVKARSPLANLSDYDSVQFIRATNRLDWGVERSKVHEIVLIRDNESRSLESLGARIVCGRPGGDMAESQTTVPCNPHHPPLQNMRSPKVNIASWLAELEALRLPLPALCERMRGAVM
jgi:hypothetical protein